MVPVLEHHVPSQHFLTMGVFAANFLSRPEEEAGFRGPPLCWDVTVSSPAPLIMPRNALKTLGSDIVPDTNVASPGR